jgi:hypothetical protein
MLNVFEKGGCCARSARATDTRSCCVMIRSHHELPGATTWEPTPRYPKHGWTPPQSLCSDAE